jgi:hypothetical protein
MLDRIYRILVLVAAVLGPTVALADAPRRAFSASGVLTGRYAWLPGRCIWFSNLGAYDYFESDAIYPSFSSGTYRSDGRVIRLVPTGGGAGAGQDGFLGVYNELQVVTWGPREYLVPKTFLVDFCDAVNAGLEPRRDNRAVHGCFLLRRGDEAVPCTGSPGVPGDFESHLLVRPVTGRVVAVDAHSARISVPRGHGLQPGMLVFAPDSLVVNSVQDTEIRASNGCCNGMHTSVRVGNEARTRPRERDRKSIGQLMRGAFL